ncbi:MAG: undecaprenyl-diphosphatase UppP [Pelolinea sp.]|nr:undecaprenyl-diphosphatase UppP [Pelolinea sp.]
MNSANNMTILQAIILGIIQGITEFLPISSSGHLVIIPNLLGWDVPSEQIFPFNVLIQISTLIAVIAFYWNDLIQITKAMLVGIKNKKPFYEIQARTGWLAIFATIPAGLVGLLFKEQIEKIFSRPDIASALLIVTAVFLLLSEKIGKRSRNIASLNWLDAVVMGVSQAVSIFPGISRSGSTISGGLIRNLDRKTAGQFTFLMAIPIMAAAGILSFIDLLKIPYLSQFLPVMIIGFITSGIVGFFSIRWLLQYITNHSLVPFAIYCLILGSGSLLLTGVNINKPTKDEIGVVENIYYLTYSMSVQWMIPTINDCSEIFSEAAFVLDQADDPTSLAKSDIHFSYDEFDSYPEFSYQLGLDALIIGVNQISPITNLTLDNLRNIYQGKVTTAAGLEEVCEVCSIGDISNEMAIEPIRLWGYSNASFLEKSIQNIFQIPFFSPGMFIAPNPSLMEQAVLLEGTAIGIFPKNAISDQLRVVPLIDLPTEQTELTIFASSQTEPDPFLKGFLECIQENFIE